MPSFTEALQQLQKSWNEEGNTQIMPGDENIYRSNPRNFLVDKLGLPDSWRQSRADEKQYLKDFPMIAGMGTVGSVGEVAPIMANVGETAAEALGGAAPSFAGRLGQVVPKEAPLGSVKVIPEAAPVLSQEAWNARVLAQNLAKQNK